MFDWLFIFPVIGIILGVIGRKHDHGEYVSVEISGKLVFTQ
jgi:hypothetical protein